MGADVPRVKLLLLGRFELQVDGCTVIDRTFQRAKAKALLKLLGVQFGGMMHRDQVLDALWPNVPPGAAANNLHKSMHYLRAATGEPATHEGIITIRDAMVSLRSDVWIDAHAFVNGCLAARSARSADGLKEALSLYRGELLPDDLYEPWTDRHRNNLRSLFIQASLDLSLLHEEQSEWREALERASAALQADPTSEDTHRVLMRLFARSGNSARALQQYDRCRNILRHELQIEPSQQTRALRDSIRDAAAREDPPDSPELNVPLPAIRRAQTDDGAAVAYWVHGQGDGNGNGMPLIVMPSLPHSDLRSEWEAPEWRGHFLRLARERMVVRYDPRAVGASRPGAADFSVGAGVADLEAVVRAARIDRFAIWAPIHAGAAAMTYAACNPHRVGALILWCCYARGTDLRPREELTSLRRLLSADWQVYSESAAQFFFAWEHQRLARHYAALIRDSSDADTARSFARAAMDYDVAELLPTIHTPTLVLHRRDMPWLSTEFAEQLAASLPCSDLRMLEGSAAVPWVDDAEEIEDMVNAFLTGAATSTRDAIAQAQPPTPSQRGGPH